MKAYKMCVDCLGSGYADDLGCCRPCDGVGFIETDIPIEQALEALKTASEYLCVDCNDRKMGRDCVNNPCRVFTDVQRAIEALEEVME